MSYQIFHPYQQDNYNNNNNNNKYNYNEEIIERNKKWADSINNHQKEKRH
jgi:hypothetical protein